LCTWTGFLLEICGPVLTANPTFAKRQVLFYRSGTKDPGVVGLMEVARDPYPDHTSWQKGSKVISLQISAPFCTVAPSLSSSC